MSDITLIDDSEQSSLVTNGLAKNGELYLKKAGSTDAGSIVVYDSGVWKTFADEGGAFLNGSSLDLDGADDYLSIPDNLTKNAWNVQAWTFSMFIKPDASEINPADTTTRQFLSGIGSSPYLAFRAGVFRYINAGGSGVNGPSLTNDWFHVMITNDTSTGSSSTAASLYIDGTFIGNTRIWQSAQGMRNVGRWYSGGHSASLVDEISIFDSVKSASDLQTAGVPNDLTSLNPVLWYRCGDGDTSPTLTNNGSAGSSLDGTLHNGPTFSSDTPS